MGGGGGEVERAVGFDGIKSQGGRSEGADGTGI